MVLGKLALVRQGPLRQMVLPEGLLQEQIAGVGVVAQDAGNAGLAPPVAVPGRYPILVQTVGDGHAAFPGKILMENTSDDLSLIRLHDEGAVPLAVAQHGPVPRPALLEVLPDAPFLVFADGQALLLRVGREDGQHELAVSGKGMQIF